LLDSLEATDSRSARRRIIERLVGMGAVIGAKIVDRLDKGQWFVQRNMLYVLSEMERMPESFDPGPWLRHADKRVRIEAIRVALGMPDARATAIVAGLRENDTRILNLALNAAIENCPTGIAPTVITVLDNASTDPAMRLTAIRVLGKTRTVEARRWLIDRVLDKTGWWRRPALAAKTQETLLALAALRQWRSNREVAGALALARESEDVEVRFAATTSSADWL
jgi:hypothetical protein